jgi:di/tricarboxylate transporter
MTLSILFSIVMILLMIYALSREWLTPGLILFSTLTIFLATGTISSGEFLAGFSNKGMITVAILFLVSEGIRQTGALDMMAKFFLPRKKGPQGWLTLKMLSPIMAMSAFLNNTPVVIIFAPMIKKWAERLGFSPRKFLIPLSYATIFGGICTLIGTSTNLVVHGLMLENGLKGFSMFELAKVGLPLGLIGFLYLITIGQRLLPETSDHGADLSKSPKEFLVEMRLLPGSPLAGKSIREAGLRNLAHFYLMAIERDKTSVETVNDDEIILENDRLLFTGVTDNWQELVEIPGLEPAAQEIFDKDVKRISQRFVEAVISPQFPGLGQTVKEFNFRSVYRAVIVAVHRNGQRINSKIGDIILKPGDNLVLLTTKNFERRWKNAQDFYMVSDMGQRQENHYSPQKALFALFLLTFMVLGATFGNKLPFPKPIKADMFFFAAIVTVIMAWTKLFRSANYTRHISWDVLITIAAAFGISKGLQNTGAAQFLAASLISLVDQWGMLAIIAGIYLMTTIFTEIITNNAAAALMFPIALATANQLNMDPHPLFVTIAIAASASFATPIGYQTNLLVQGIGGYKFTDYVKIGLPLNIISMIVTVALVSFWW